MYLGRHMLVLGLGASGLAIARWCARNGATVTVADTRPMPPQLTCLRESVPGAVFVHGPLDAALLKQQAFIAIFKSPGLSPQDTNALETEAKALGIPVGGEITLFSQALAHLKDAHQYQPKLLAITGTNGKTTVTALTSHLVSWAGKSVATAGNIGPTLLDTLAQAQDSGNFPEVWVLELSSFQLDVEAALEPTAAVVLNVTQDHLDWHTTMSDYVGAKAKIFGNQGLMVLNRDDSVVMDMLPAPVRVKLQRPQFRSYVTFGTDMPKRPGDFGLEEVNGMVWLVRAMEADETRKQRKDVEQELYVQRLMPADALRIRGRHNASNALAALALCAAAQCQLGPLLFGLREYRGEPHRVQSLGILRGVEYFDDSKGTNVGATVAALCGLGEDRKLVVILGGEGKGQEFAPLVQPVIRYARSVVLIGRDAPRIRHALEHTGITLEDAQTLEGAVALASQRAHSGDAVLMSPACASFDMFDNYEHRARIFGDAVKALALDAGQDLEATA